MSQKVKIILSFLIYDKNLLILLEIIRFLLSETKYKTKYGTGLKILTPKQML